MSNDNKKVIRIDEYNVKRILGGYLSGQVEIPTRGDVRDANYQRLLKKSEKQKKQPK